MNANECSRQIGKKIAYLRKKRGVPAKTLSELIDKSSGYINKLENGACTPSLQTICDLCDYFQIDPAVLLDGNYRYPDLIHRLIQAASFSSERKLKTLVHLAENLNDSVNLASEFIE